MNRIIKISLTLLVIVVLLLIGSFSIYAIDKFYFQNREVSLAIADDDEEEEEEEDEDDDDDDDDNEPKKTETVTTYVTLPDRITKKITTTTKYDSDGDGILDEDDKYPKINDNYIVKDENKNGIVDSYE